jgi:hypothetical protein
MRVLCISPFFPPTRDSEAFCSGKMVRALQEQGAEVTTLYLDAPYLQGKQDPSAMWRSLQTSSEAIGDPVGQARTRALCCMLRYRTLVWPRWIGSVVERASELQRVRAFDLVYSRSLPMFSHIAGYWTARSLKRPWVANINDPWDEHLFPEVERPSASPWHRRVSNYWLRKTLSSAALVTFPSRRLASYTAGLTSASPRTEIIPHIGIAGRALASGEDFRLVHAGKLGTNEITGRSSRALLLGFRRLLKGLGTEQRPARLVLVGPEDPQNRAMLDELGLRSAVSSVGLVSYEESLQHIASASVCVLIEAPMREGIYLPSKLADYIAARKPVLALSPRIGTISDLASRSGITVVDPGDDKQIERALRSLYQRHCKQRLREPAADLVDTFSAEGIARRFLSAARELLQGQQLDERARPVRSVLPAAACCDPASRA